MPLDAFSIRAISLELSSILAFGRIDKVSHPSRDEIILGVRNNSQNFKLLINTATPRIHFLTTNRENPKTPPMFCMLLRKHLVGALIKSVSSPNFERLIEFELDTYDELGFKTTKYLIVELLGKFSNVILLNHERLIIDCLKRVDFESSSRPLQPNIYYDYPPSQNKISILDLNTLPSSRDDLLSKVLGFSPFLADLIFDEDTSIYKQNVDILKDSTKNDDFSLYFYNRDDKTFDFSIIDNHRFHSVKQDNFSTCLAHFFESREKNNALNSLYKELLKLTKNLIKRKERKVEIQNTELLDTLNRDTFKTYGDLIISNLHSISSLKQDSITLINYYDEAMSKVSIPLDITLSPKQNADKYFLKYTKLKSAEVILKSELDKAHSEIFYLESILDCLSRAENSIELLEIKQELIDYGYIRQPSKSKKSIQISKPNYHLSSDGFTIIVGKNNKQNDELTLKTASKNDIWLHTHNIHGSHTIILTDGRDVPHSTILEASALCAFNSKAQNSDNVPVDYCPVSHVKKPRGAKAGMVIYDNYNTVYVTPKKELSHDS